MHGSCGESWVSAGRCHVTLTRLVHGEVGGSEDEVGTLGAGIRTDDASWTVHIAYRSLGHAQRQPLSDGRRHLTI